MTTTVNISLPRSLYEDAKKLLVSRGYTSISEVMRDALRHLVHPHVTENGFTPEFEEEVLRSAAEPVKNDIVLETDEDIDNYFKHLKFLAKKRKVNDKNTVKR